MAEIEPIDKHLDALLSRLATKPSPELSAAVRLLSSFGRQGHVCIALADVGKAELEEIGLANVGNPKSWSKALRESGVVGTVDEHKPLVLDHAGRLYLQRYWEYEKRVADELIRRSRSEEIKFYKQKLNSTLANFFAQNAEMQKLAAFVAATRKLCVISGAPGTGKTRTVVLACALMIALSDEPLTFALAAPTGKAAARLKETVAQCRAELDLPPEIAAQIPGEASTIQRLLGARGNSIRFQHNAERPLNADVVVVDEASMVDLALLAKLLTAVRPDARLLLIGDKDQLASVEAGSVFRDICSPGTETGVSQELARKFAAATGVKLSGAMPRQAPLQDCIVELRKNYRFRDNDAIAQLSRAVNAGDVETALAVVERGEAVTLRSLPKMLERELRAKVLPHFQRLAGLRDPVAALREQGNFAVLCAVRRGPTGAETINRLLAEMLRGSERERYFHGLPLMIVRNDYQSGLFNGDLGIVLADDEGKSRAYFPGEADRARAFALGRLPEHESAFALTVHKSQGSEFRRALMILPERDTPVLTRELLYTGVTRVREGLEIWARRDVFAQALRRKVQRASGLADALWNEAKGKKG
ncbi:MAG: exodeoxyribonuclease V subunit alpha [Verrucomicrobiota bacterium]|nr:exodeoxyribonuclease V subunit alpha [Verrucomicrobiota bacterium]